MGWLSVTCPQTWNFENLTASRRSASIDGMLSTRVMYEHRQRLSGASQALRQAGPARNQSRRPRALVTACQRMDCDQPLAFPPSSVPAATRRCVWPVARRGSSTCDKMRMGRHAGLAALYLMQIGDVPTLLVWSIGHDARRRARD